MRETAVEDKQFLFVRSAIEALLNTFNLNDKMDVVEVGRQTIAGKKVEKYLSMARIGDPRKNKIDVNHLNDLIVEDLKHDNVKKIGRQYFVFVLRRNLYDNEHGDMIALQGMCCDEQRVFVTVQDTPLKFFSEREIKMVAIHELGHMFGLLPNGRSTKVSRDGSGHCRNRCIMKVLPNFHTRLTGAKLSQFLSRKFCRLCKNFLLRKFRKANCRFTVAGAK